jgi:hypothetical protein
MEPAINMLTDGSHVDGASHKYVNRWEPCRWSYLKHHELVDGASHTMLTGEEPCQWSQQQIC